MASLAIVGRIVLREIPPGFLVLARVTGAAVLILVIQKTLGRGRVRDRSDLLRFAILGFLGISANQTLFLLGLRLTTAVNATILVTTIPVFTVLESLIARREPPSWKKIMGIGLAATGAVYLIGPDRISLAPEAALGNGLILVGMVCYSLYLVHSKALVSRYSALTASYYVMLFGALGVLPFGLTSLAGMHPGRVSPQTWVLIGYIVLCPTILAYSLNLWALRRVSPNLVAASIYLQPLFTAAISPLVLPGERLTARAIIAGAAIFLGLAVVILAERAENRELPAEQLPGE
jgi:drug/metabolite transporter (DMT)-like permease